MTTEAPAHHSEVIQNQAVNPQSVSIEAHNVFRNGDTALTPVGSTIQKISRDLTFLNMGWLGLPDAKISQGKQDEMIEDVVCKFSDIAEDVGLDPEEPDLSLLPSLIRRYKEVVAIRESVISSK